MTIIGKWQTFWSNRPNSHFDDRRHICEYTDSGHFLREYAPHEEGGEPLKPIVQCEYGDGKVTHISRSGESTEYAYSIDKSDILIITHRRGDIWKLKRIIDDERG